MSVTTKLNLAAGSNLKTEIHAPPIKINVPRMNNNAPRMNIARQKASWLARAALLLHFTSVTIAGLNNAQAGAPTTDAKAAQDATLAPEMRDGAIRAQHGDWQIVCKPPPTGAKNEVCALVQSVTAEDRNNVGLTIYFQKFSNGVRVLRVFAPLGVLLPPGIGLKVDGVDIGHAPFLRCHTFACYAQVTVEDKLIDQLKNGQTAIFIIFQTEEAGIGIPISLKGFGEALAALQ